ncbi:MAG: hypothetical protein K0R80_1970 [Clostridia bacterium]|nr:hypothetical protein [Clostridia bacterium]
MKKFIMILLTLTIALSSVVHADGTMINDIDQSSSYAKNAIIYLAQKGIISGDQNGNFNPKKSVTRVEMVVLMAKAMNLDTSKTPEKATFMDVPVNNWAARYVEAAYQQGIITGISATEFKPNDKITREQMAVIFIRALKLLDKDTAIEIINIDSFGDKAKISAWAQKEVEVAIEAGLMNGVSSKTFEPKTAANKEQSAVVIERLMKNKDAIISIFKAPASDANALHPALEKLVFDDYVGEVKAQGEIKLKDIKTNNFSKSSFDMTDKINDNYTSWSYAKETSEITGQAPEIVEYESIIMNKKYYEKDFADKKWTQIELESGLVYAYAPFFDPIFENEEVWSTDMNAVLFENFNRIDVKNEGTVYISGVPAAKYAMVFDVNTIKNTMPDDEYAIVKEFADNAFQGKLNYRYEFYVANNHVIKQSFEFDGNVVDAETGNTLNYHSFTNMFYKNIGKQSVITAPAASAIKSVTK